MERIMGPFDHVAQPISHAPSMDKASADMEGYYKSDEFRMTAMKVLPCSKRYVHDWTECPFAHPQEKARRRDPRTHNYTGIACPSMKREGACAFGDWCPYAHNVFEYWLHPTRYRTQLCNDGSNCRRKICFFAHSLDELRVPACKPFVSPEALATAAAAAAAETDARRRSGTVGPPSANLNLTPAQSARLSLESVRQSQDWGPVPMPPNLPSSAPARVSQQQAEGAWTTSSGSPGLVGADSADISPAGSAGGGTIASSQDAAIAGFSSRDENIVDTITQMLAKDTLTPEQAASLLRQMLPASTLQALQSRLGYVEMSPSLAATVGMDHASRPSLESSRSSFDTARMSFEGNARMSSDFGGPSTSSARGSVDSVSAVNYAPPAPAYPEYWTGEGGVAPPASPLGGANASGPGLTSVPEGMPMINVPPPSNPWGGSGGYSRRSSGSGGGGGAAAAAGGNNNLPAAARLATSFNRMSFDEDAAAAGAAGKQHSEHVGPESAFASAFFNAQGGHR